eukprot:TRINITY_DN27928_c0_g1_i2.p1 TRINITY_DN27928_c0_g1~~TRINITY_DN27928_c0_g1_i2.p1  ORF type:complete len:372 (+),score=37.22 TRINITY_DN27928_c0_g1_i2:113-1228(+)
MSLGLAAVGSQGSGRMSSSARECQRPTGLTSFGIFVQLIKINWGIGMMAMPFYLYSSGLVMGSIFFACSMMLVGSSVDRIVRCKEALEAADQKAGPTQEYGDLMQTILGPAGRFAALFSILCANWGSCVAYSKWLGDNLAVFITGVSWTSEVWVWATSIPLAVAAIVVKDVTALQPFAILGLACSQGFALIVVCMAVDKAVRHHADGESFPEFVSTTPWLNAASFIPAMGLANFCNEGICVMSPQLHTSMAKPQNWKPMLILTVIYFGLNYLAVAVAGFYLHPVPAQEMTLNFGPENLPFRCAVYLYALQILMCYVLVYFVAMACVSSCVRIVFPVLYSDHPAKMLRPFAKAGGVCLAAFLAIRVPSFATF